jgi:hypothetical protein
VTMRARTHRESTTKFVTFVTVNIGNKTRWPRTNVLGLDPIWPKGESDLFMPRELYLQLTARECLANGRLPRMHSQCIWGGYGRGDICSLCGEPIRSTEVEFEVPEPEDGDPHADHWHGTSRTGLKFHINCHAVWQLECADDETATGAENTD